MMESLVSVIIPVYNVEKYVAQALDSVIKQTYKNLEIIVIDDGSTDKSGAICDKFARRDSRIRLIHQENKGLATVRNIGVKEANGDYIAWLDSDDWMELNTIEVMVRIAVEHKADIVEARYSLEYIEKAIQPKNERKPELLHGHEITHAFVDGKLYDNVWNKLFRSACIFDIRFPDGRDFEDVATTWKILKKLTECNGSMHILPNVLFHRRMRKSSIVNTQTLRNIIDRWNAYRDKYEAFPETQFLYSCIMVIWSMWIIYYDFTKDEKLKAQCIIHEMISFINEHHQEIMRSNYSMKTKAISILEQNLPSPIVLWICRIIRKMRSSNFSYRKLYE